MSDFETVTGSDGRTLAYAIYGREDGAQLLFHHGIPGSCLLGSVLDDVARERDVRVIPPSRPGDGASDSRLPLCISEHWWRPLKQSSG